MEGPLHSPCDTQAALSSQQVHPVLQQLLLGFAREAEGTILRVREARAAGSGHQLLEVGLLGRAAAGIHSCGGVPVGEETGQQLRGVGWALAGHPNTPNACRGSDYRFDLQARGTTVLLSFQLWV